jgi:hypothetical protein
MNSRSQGGHRLQLTIGFSFGQHNLQGLIFGGGTPKVPCTERAVAISLWLGGFHPLAAAITFAKSRSEAPIVNSERTNRSNDTDGSPASIFATLD